ncbi:MAG TPA: hypothetical protein VFW33_18550 [Gemmataceae bacterium]|nr:hypothetical protein [Gemmataceae bacterium]
MAIEQFTNNAQSSLTAAIAAGDTSLTVANASAFPTAGNFRVLIDGEILLVTAVAGNTFTVTRGAEGTTAAAHAVSAYVTHVLTAGSLLNCPRSMTAGGDLEYLAASGAVTRLAAGSNGQALTLAGGLPAWATPAVFDLLSTAAAATTAITNANTNLAYATGHYVKATTGPVTVTLPAPALSGGKTQRLLVTVTGDSTQLVTLGAHAGENIGPGTGTGRVMWAGEAALLEVTPDGANWEKVAGLTRPMVCRMYLGAAQTLANGSVTTITLDSVPAGGDTTGLMADTSGHQIVVRRTGTYAVGGLGEFTEDGTNVLSADAPRCVVIASHSGGTCGWQVEQFGSAGGYPTFGLTLAGPAAAGDTIQLQMFQDMTNGHNGKAAAGNSATALAAAEVPSW